jgi:hypothetical protein
LPSKSSAALLALGGAADGAPPPGGEAGAQATRLPSNETKTQLRCRSIDES